jgi:hypothetical protein
VPGDRKAEPMPGATPGVSGEGFAARTSAAEGPPLAPPPIETPGPSVTPPQTPESDVERAERADAGLPAGQTAAAADVPRDETDATGDALVAQEASAAAAEAARIGGVVEPEVSDPAMEPVYQAGGGEQDGWEAAEAELIENATHDDGHGDPERDAFTPELEADRAGAVYGESDSLPSTEVLEDPTTGPDDPDAGPDLTADRGSPAQPREDPPSRLD